jgi:hypothetical protein
MGLLCTCPPAAALTALTISNCPTDIGQIQKILFQRKYTTGTTLNKFTIASANPNVLASWTALTGASDGTKVVPSPLVSNPETEAGDAITFGGGNATIGGIEEIVGRAPTAFTASYYKLDPVTARQMKALMCEDLAVYLCDEFGRVIGLADDNSSATEFYPIPVRGLFVSDRDLGGLEEPDTVNIQFSFLPNWSDQLYIVTPTDFSPLTDI